jgi:hypothetical protein
MHYKELVKATRALVEEEAKKKKAFLLTDQNAAFFQPKTKANAPVEPIVQFAPVPQMKKEVSQEPEWVTPRAQEKPAPVVQPVKKVTPPAQEWKKEVVRNFPGLGYVETPPNDTRAKEAAVRWKKYETGAKVLILAFGEKEEELLYLKNLAKAIHTKLKTTKIIDAQALENDKKWETFFGVNQFELIIASKQPLFSSPELKRYFQEESSISLPLLAKAPLILLTPEVKQDKASLWKKICQLLTK